MCNENTAEMPQEKQCASATEVTFEDAVCRGIERVLYMLNRIDSNIGILAGDPEDAGIPELPQDNCDEFVTWRKFAEYMKSYESVLVSMFRPSFVFESPDYSRVKQPKAYDRNGTELRVGDEVALWFAECDWCAMRVCEIAPDGSSVTGTITAIRNHKIAELHDKVTQLSDTVTLWKR